jgi:hypothetical protein
LGADGDGLTVSTLNATTATIGAVTATSATVTNASVTTLTATNFAIQGTVSGLTVTTFRVLGETTGTTATFGAVTATTLNVSGSVTGTTATFGPVVTDVISEKTSGAGVTIDGAIIKDSAISGEYTPLFLDTEKATTSGTSIDFTGIPSWVKRITMIFNAVSTAGSTGNIIVRLGDAGGIETTGYVATSSTPGGNTDRTNGFVLRQTDASTDVLTGHMVITKISGNTWVSSHTVMAQNDSGSSYGAGRKTLSDTLTQIRLTTETGTGAFDAGSVNIIYE